MDSGIAKFVLAGPVGAGKSTLIRALADGEPVSTEMPMSEGPMGEKTTTTVALDFATIMLDDGTPLYLYGLPGQEHFGHMREIVLRGAVGVMILLSARSSDIAGDCAHWLQALRGIDADLAFVIGITHGDSVADFRMDKVRQAIRECGPPIPVFTVDARDRDQAAHLARALLLSIS